MHLVCAFDALQILRYFLLYGIAIISKINQSSKQSLIHICSWFGSSACLGLLMRNGLSIEEKNSHGQLPLHLAAKRGKFSCLQILLKEMMNPNESDLNGKSALHAAVIHNQLECAEELLKFENVRVSVQN